MLSAVQMNNSYFDATTNIFVLLLEVFTMRMGGYPRVVISGYDAMHQLLIASADHTSSRAITFTKYIKSRSERGKYNINCNIYF